MDSGENLAEDNTTATIIEPDCAVLDYNWDDLGKYDLMARKKGEGLGGEEYYLACFMVFKTKLLRGADFTGGFNKGKEEC